MAEPTYRFVARTLDSGLLSLPWNEPLAGWTTPNLVDLERGIGRHVVRFVELGAAFYALKELPEPVAHREYTLLSHLEGTNVPAVEPVGVVAERRDANGAQLPEILVTRYLEYSLPFRTVLGRRILAHSETVLADALAGLLVRLHLAGFFWGDCSLSNALFRRDAGALAAYLVDVETGELQQQLSDGQRRYDLDIAAENITYEFADVVAEFGWDGDDDPTALADALLASYDSLWSDLTEEEIFALDETSRLERRLEELNELGFEVEEVELVRTANDYRLRVPSAGVEAGYHRGRLLRLTGLDAQENQARRLLADIRAFRDALERIGETPVSDAAAGGRWVSEVFEPTVAAIPTELHGRRAAAELFHELLAHRDRLSEREEREVGISEALDSYVDAVLRPAPDERTALLQRRG